MLGVVGLNLPHTVPPFAFFLSNVLLDESFLVGVWVWCRQEG